GADPAPTPGRAPPGSGAAVAGARRRPLPPGEDGTGPPAGRGAGRRHRHGDQGMSTVATSLSLGHFLALGSILFCIAVAGIFINRKNVIVLLMCIELLLLAVNINFVAFSRHLGGASGQVLVFFSRPLAPADAAIGLAILLTLFRNRPTIDVAGLDSSRGGRHARPWTLDLEHRPAG